MEIVTNYNEYSEKKDVILLDEVSITYIQEPDCTEDNDYQKLTISTRDNGVAKFLNIKTTNWSFDNAESLSTVIKDFCDRIGYNE